jgi:plasmid maintenance system killer protein
MEKAINIPLSQYNALEEARQLLSDTDFVKKLRRLMAILDAAKSPDEFENWYMGNDFEDLQKTSFKNTWSEEDKIWDHV